MTKSKNQYKNCTQAFLFETIENQRETQNPKRSQSKKNLTYRRTNINITSNFSEVMQARRECNEIFEVLRGKNVTDMLRNEREWKHKIFHVNHKRLDKVRRQKQEQIPRVTNRKVIDMVDSNPSLSINTLKISSLNEPIKRQTL